MGITSPRDSWLLHQIGVVWGGGNASNVLIHSDSDDARVIGFGGQWTGSWLDLKEAPTVEGDEIAVKKILSSWKFENMAQISLDDIV